jgi:hypothetical protein
MQRARKIRNGGKTLPRRARTGYRLQLARLRRTGKEGVRSFKFPLMSDASDSSDFAAFAQRIETDYRNLVGPLNLSDWYENEQRGGGHYSLADFWLDSLRMGVIFAHKDAEMANIILFLNCDISLRERVLDAVRRRDARLYALAKKKELYEFFVSPSRPDKKTKEAFAEGLYKKLFSSVQENDVARAREYATQFSDWVFGGVKKARVAELLGFDPKAGRLYPYTFFFSPHLSRQEEASPKQLLAAYRSYLHDDRSPYRENDQEKQIKMVLGLYNNHGAFSNYFNEALTKLQSDSEAIVRAVCDASPYWREHEQELRARVEYLARAAKKLRDATLDDRGWHYYRSSFGGKLESWVSNTVRQEKLLRAELFSGEEARETSTERDAQRVKNKKAKEEKGKKTRVPHEAALTAALVDPMFKEETRELVRQCQSALAQLRTELNDDLLAAYRLLLGELRTALMEDFQLAASDGIEPGEAIKKSRKPYESLFARVKLIPNFMGDTKRSVYGKFIRAPRQLKEGIRCVTTCAHTLEQSDYNPRISGAELVEHAHKVYETLRRKYPSLNATRYKHIVESLFSVRRGVLESGDSFNVSRLLLSAEEYSRRSSSTPRFVLWKPTFGRSQAARVMLDISSDDAPAILKQLATALAPRWDDIIATNDFGELLDACEMEKIRLGILVTMHHKTAVSIDIDALSSELFSSAHAYFSFLGKPASLAGETLGRFLQAFILSELRGAIAKMSRTEHVERYTVQTLGSEERFPLCLRDSGGKRLWCIANEPPTVLRGRYTQCPEGKVAVRLKAGKAFGANDEFTAACVEPASLFALHTSTYHLQFLDKALGGPSSWWSHRKFNLKMGEPSFIVERAVRTTWDIVKEWVSFERGEPRVCASIPFTVRGTEEVVPLDERSRYMGIDVGEYGLAWTIVERGDRAKVGKIVASGFLFEPLTHEIRNFVQTLKARQSLGTFGAPSTKLGRLRENAVTSLRNQVHDIALRYRAVPAYEAEISNFESGGNRVKVVYDSVKRADVDRSYEDDAGTMEANLVWGKMAKQFGKQVGAYATSYLCTKCGRSPYEEQDEAQKKEKKEGSRPSVADFKKLESKQFADLQQHPLLRQNSEGVSQWEERRGNSALYVCQYCNHVSDADRQAAYWIALKRILRDRKGKKADADNEGTNEKFDLKQHVAALAAAHRKSGHPPIELEL